MYTMTNLSFWQGKRVFVTGHTGFKGSWLCKMLVNAGAQVAGYALEPPTEPSLFNIAGIGDLMDSTVGDIRDYGTLSDVFNRFAPEIVFHLAAQPIVRDSYKNPLYTYETNVMGTVHLLECARLSGSVRSFLNVTTDKVYLNTEKESGYTEDEPLDGFDPYSNSKSCSELATHSYKNSFFKQSGAAVSTARAGNVLGGGDFANDRIIPDCVRAARKGERVIVRNPFSVRPYQHVIEPLAAYMMIASAQFGDDRFAGWYNVGPDEGGCVQTGVLTDLFCRAWGEGMAWEDRSDGGPHEANLLKLDCAKLKQTFGWRPLWDIAAVVDKTVEWTKIWLAGGDVPGCMDRQIEEYYKARETSR